MLLLSIPPGVVEGHLRPLSRAPDVSTRGGAVLSIEAFGGTHLLE